MGFHHLFIFYFAILLSFLSTYETTTLNQTEFFTLLKSSFSGNTFGDWDGTNVCDYAGITCDDKGYVVKINISRRSLSGRFPENICSYLPYLKTLDIGYNNIHGELPYSITNCSLLEELITTHTSLTGKLPDFSPMKSLRVLDMAYCAFSGKFPLSLINLTNLEVMNFNENAGFDLWRLPDDIFRLSKLKILILSTCMVSGPIPKSIGNMTSLVDLELCGNYLVGPVPRELGLLKNLKQLELYYNQLVGEIPEELGNLTNLRDIDISVNQLTGRIPEVICRLPHLRVVQFYNNSLTGHIPRVLEDSKTLTTLSLYRNYLTGEVPRHLGRSSPLMLIDLSENQLTGELPAEICNGEMDEIVEAMIDKNVVGHGGSGTVYKIDLSNGEVVAVKRLWSQKAKDESSDDQQIMNRELKTEVETLGNIRHKNIVKLYCYFSGFDCNLLVYEYMPNGNLWDALHRGKCLLDWPTRHQIALGVAQGLAYLHHDLMPPIIHRDIKSTNILLDRDFQPKVADFGIAKVLRARGKDSTTTIVAGSYGYLAPEYAYSCKATTKCDVYSFGVVLMELITGKKPVEVEFGENKNIIYWISTKVETKEGAFEVLDKRLSGYYNNDIIKVLRIAIRCTCQTATLRPSMNEVVQLLIEANPCKSEHCKSPNKTKEQLCGGLRVTQFHTSHPIRS
ncbi:putative protein kinase RLK-Pelle-LRR-XI-1 family [Helianthus annuus]|nr:putative protein kinase RLK-Pelle-LRR-XI-1 family [Helianthus annuus]